MKPFIKTYAKIGTLILGITLFFTTCQKDDVFIDEVVTENNQKQVVDNQKQVSVKRVTLKEIEQDQALRSSFSDFEKSFDFFKAQNTGTKNLQNSKSSNTSIQTLTTDITDVDNTFTILTDEIVQVSTDLTDAYTFLIEEPTKSDSYFENFVITKHIDGDYQFYIYRYKALDTAEDLEFKYIMSREQIDSNQIDLEGIGFEMYYDESSSCLYDITYDLSCQCMYAQVLWCNTGGGDGSSDPLPWEGNNTGDTSDGDDLLHDDNNGGGTLSGNDTTTDSETNKEVTDIAVLLTPIDKAINTFFNCLTNEQKLFLNNRRHIRAQIEDYLKANSEPARTRLGSVDAPLFSTETLAFAKEAVEALRNDADLTFEEYIELINDCNLLSEVSNSLSFQERMQELIDHSTNNTEVGYWGRIQDGNMLYHDNWRFEGQQDVVGVETNIPSIPVDSFIHNHFNNGNSTLSVFSGSDLVTLYQLYTAGMISDIDNFVMLVTTPGNNVNSIDDDTVYAVTINNVAELQTNGALFLLDSLIIDEFYRDPDNRINANISNELNEERFTRLLKNLNLGLTLYRGDRNDLNSWTKLKIKNDDTLKEKNCN